MFTREKFFSVYEKPEAADPAERVVLVREGFAWMAFLFGGLWLIWHRLWRVLALYLALIVGVTILAYATQVSNVGLFLLLSWLKLMFGFHANDLRGWSLMRQGHRFAGVLTAESKMLAERRYYEFAS